MADVELELPAVVALLRDAEQLQGADGGGAGGEGDGDAPGAAALAAAEDGGERGEGEELVAADAEDVAGLVVGADGGGEQGEGDGLSEGELELGLGEVELVALFVVLGDDEDGGDLLCRGLGGGGGGVGLDGDVVGAGDAAADALAADVAEPAVVGGAHGDGELEGGVAEDLRLPGLSGAVVPAVEDVDEAVAEQVDEAQQRMEQLQHLDGVMVGREAYHNPWWLARWDALYYGEQGGVPCPLTREEVELAMVEYMEREAAQYGTPWAHIARHMLGLRHSLAGARIWRQVWSNHLLKDRPAREVYHLAQQAVAESLANHQEH